MQKNESIPPWTNSGILTAGRGGGVNLLSSSSGFRSGVLLDCKC